MGLRAGKILGGRRLSKPMEALISSMMRGGTRPKRPPHILFVVMRFGMLRRLPMLSGSNFAIWGAIFAVLVVAAYFLYGTGGAGVHEGRLEVRDPPAVLDKLQITQQAAGPRRGRGWRRGEGRRGQGREQGRERGRRGGGPAVQAVWSDANGNPVRLDDYRGRLVVLNLSATWCAPCITELPALARAKAQLAGDGVAVIAVDLEKKSAADIAAFLNSTAPKGWASPSTTTSP